MKTQQKQKISKEKTSQSRTKYRLNFELIYGHVISKKQEAKNEN